MDYRHILAAIGIGIGATLITDIWNFFLKQRFNIQSLNFCFLGRWILYMPKGKFRHANIKATQPKHFECAVGWLVHYSIGIILTLIFIAIVSVKWLIQPTLFYALIYGISTVVFPLFILQPSLGLGLASSKSSNPAQARLKSLMTHIFFGLGIWLSGITANYLFFRL